MGIALDPLPHENNMTAVYTARDPRFEITCEPCTYGVHNECIREFVINMGSIRDGSYRCACFRCKTR